MSDDLNETASEEVPPEVDEGANRSASEEALRRFFASGFQPGALLTHTWLQDALGMDDRSAANSFEAFTRWQYDYMARFSEFQKTLLLTHNIALANVFGKGYRLVLPNEQSAWALQEVARELRKSFSKASARATHVNLDALTPTERTEQSNDLNRLRSLREMFRRDEAAARARARRSAMMNGDEQ